MYSNFVLNHDLKSTAMCHMETVDRWVSEDKQWSHIVSGYKTTSQVTHEDFWQYDDAVLISANRQRWLFLKCGRECN